MQVLSETAPAKINLTLKILGRRDDGYHEVESLVAFADVGDVLTLTPGDGAGLHASGEFAKALGQENLVLQAWEQVRQIWPDARAGTFNLEKNLPVAAGIGGGSSDAAAVLRLLARANRDIDMENEIARLAVALGADVKACLEPEAAMMRGLGEVIEPLTAFPKVHVVLVNPGVPVPTGKIFQALGAEPLPAGFSVNTGTPALRNAQDLARFVRTHGNDLATAASKHAPVIEEVREALGAAAGCLAEGLSGSGATCFGLFANREEADQAAASLARVHENWWVRSGSLR